MAQLPPLNEQGRRERAALANARRFHPNSPETAARARDFKAARLSDYIRQQIESAPPLTDDQREALARILRPDAEAPTRIAPPDFAAEFFEATFGVSADDSEDRESVA